MLAFVGYVLINLYDDTTFDNNYVTDGWKQ